MQLRYATLLITLIGMANGEWLLSKVLSGWLGTTSNRNLATSHHKPAMAPLKNHSKFDGSSLRNQKESEYVQSLERKQHAFRESLGMTVAAGAQQGVIPGAFDADDGHLSQSFTRYLSWRAPISIPLQVAELGARVRIIDALLAEYVTAQQAGSRTWLQKPCVSGYYECPARIGNHMHQFLNALAFAILRNIPFAWEQGSEDSHDLPPCDALLRRAAWMEAAEASNGGKGSVGKSCRARRGMCLIGDAIQPWRSRPMGTFQFEDRMACSASLPLSWCIASPPTAALPPPLTMPLKLGGC